MDTKKLGMALGGLAAVLGLAVLGLVAAISMQPSEFSVERSATVAARPEVVHGLIADFKLWPKWSPWEDLDPTITHTYDGAPSGEGAITTWKGDGQVGAGKMTITKATPERIDIALEFTEPFASQSPTYFALKGSGSTTTVVWHMDGTNDFMGKAFSMMVDMDAMLGADFEKGLGRLDAVAQEAEKAKQAEEAAARAAAEAAALAAGGVVGGVAAPN